MRLWARTDARGQPTSCWSKHTSGTTPRASLATSTSASTSCGVRTWSWSASWFVARAGAGATAVLTAAALQDPAVDDAGTENMRRTAAEELMEEEATGQGRAEADRVHATWDFSRPSES